MKLNTFQRHDFTANLWRFQATTDGSGGTVRTYFLDRNINVRVVTSVAGRLFIYFMDSEHDAVNKCLLYNLKDASGTEVRDGGVWELDKCEPNMNVWGLREGFKGIANYLGSETDGTGAVTPT